MKSNELLRSTWASQARPQPSSGQHAPPMETLFLGTTGYGNREGKAFTDQALEAERLVRSRPLELRPSTKYQYRKPQELCPVPRYTCIIAENAGKFTRHLC